MLIFSEKFIIFFLFLLITLIVGTHLNRLIKAVMSTHNLSFRAKIRKYVYPCTPQLHFIKVGCKWVLFTRTCFRDVTAGLYITITHPRILYYLSLVFYYFALKQKSVGTCWNRRSNVNPLSVFGAKIRKI